MSSSKRKYTPCIPLKPAIPAERVKAYASIGFFITVDELPASSTQGLADIKRLGRENMLSFLEMMIQAKAFNIRQNADPIRAHAYLVRTESAVFIIISVDTRQDMINWCENLFDFLNDRRKYTPVARAKQKFVDGYGPRTMPTYIQQLNACFHPRLVSKEDSASLFARSTESYDTRDVACQPTDEQQGATYLTKAAIDNLLKKEPCAIVNPFVALNVHRVFSSDVLHHLCNGTITNPGEFFFMAPDSAVSVFSEGFILPENTVKGIHILRFAVENLCRERIFCNILPPYPRLKSLIIARSTPEINRAVENCDPHILSHKVLMQEPLVNPDTGVADVFVANPLLFVGDLTESVDTMMFRMPYLTEAAAVAKQVLAQPFDTDEVKNRLALLMVSAINTMADSVDITALGPEQIAKAFIEGHNEFGLHWLQSEHQLTKEGAEISYLIDQFDYLGAADTHTSILLRAVYCANTFYITRNGAVHCIFSGLPCSSKSYSLEKIFAVFMPSARLTHDLSPKSLQNPRDPGAVREHHKSLVVTDEVDTNKMESIGISFLKMCLAGESDAKRKVHMGREEEVKGESEVPNFHLIGISNMSASSIFQSLEKDNIKQKSAMLSRILGTWITSSSSSEPDLTPALLDRSGLAEDRAAKAKELRYFMALVQMTCMFIAYDIIPRPGGELFYSTVSNLTREFNRFNPEDPRGNGGRSEIAIYNLACVHAVTKAIYHHMARGREHKSATTFDVCRMIVNAMTTCVLDEEDIIWGFSMIADAMECDDDSAQFARILLDNLDVDSFSYDEPFVQIVNSWIQHNWLKTRHASADKLKEDIVSLCHKRVSTKDSETSHMYAALRCDNNEFKVQKKFLALAVRPGFNDFDEFIMAALIKLNSDIIDCLESADSEAGKRYADLKFSLDVSQDQPEDCKTPVEVDFHDLFIALQDIFKSRRKPGEPNMILETFKKRMHLKFISTDSRFLREVNETRVERARIGLLKNKYRVQIMPHYFNMFFPYKRRASKITQAVQRAITIPGNFPVCVPSQKDSRLTECACITEEDAEENKETERKMLESLGRDENTVPVILKSPVHANHILSGGRYTARLVMSDDVYHNAVADRMARYFGHVFRHPSVERSKDLHDALAMARTYCLKRTIERHAQESKDAASYFRFKLSGFREAVRVTAQQIREEAVLSRLRLIMPEEFNADTGEPISAITPQVQPRSRTKVQSPVRLRTPDSSPEFPRKRVNSLWKRNKGVTQTSNDDEDVDRQGWTEEPGASAPEEPGAINTIEEDMIYDEDYNPFEHMDDEDYNPFEHMDDE